MRIAVTGGTGFIGRHVVAAAVQRGHSVRVLSRRASPSSADRVEFVAADLRSATGLADRLRDCDAVVHAAAALAGPLEEQHAITVAGTANLLGAMADAAVARIVGVGTFAVYDYTALDAGAVLDEDAPIEHNFDARAPYIRVKHMQEQLIRAAADGGPAWTIVRPGLVFGPGRTWFHHLGVRLRPDVWLCLAPDALLPLTHVDNCAEAIVLAIESDAARGTTLNIVDDALPVRRAYTESLAALDPARPRIIGVPWGVLAGAARTGGLVQRVLAGRAPLPDLLREPSLHARCKPLRYTNARAKAVLGWRPRIHWKEGLASAASIYGEAA